MGPTCTYCGASSAAIDPVLFAQIVDELRRDLANCRGETRRVLEVRPASGMVKFGDPSVPMSSSPYTAPGWKCAACMRDGC